MSPLLLTVLGYTLIPVAAALVGSGAAAFREPGPKLRSAFQHFAAGVVFATAALELLPDLEKVSPVAVIIGFVAGVALMLGLRTFSRRLESKSGGGAVLPIGLLAATGVDRLIDGLVMGIGFAVNPALGIIVTVALAMEVIFVSVSITATLAKTGISRAAAVAIPTGITVLTMVTAALGALVFSGLSTDQLAPVLAFGAAALMYLVTEELLGEAHEEDEKAVVTAMFFLGFLVFQVLDMLAPGGNPTS